VILECVINVSEGRDEVLLAGLAAQCRAVLLDRHRDPDHHRSVFTLGGAPDDVESAARSLTAAAVAALDLSAHEGAHPRFGVVDVVPFVSLSPAPDAPPGLVDGTLDPAVAARDRFAGWAGDLGLPCFLYGPVGGATRSLPDVRRGAFTAVDPDTGPLVPHPVAGVIAVGARPALVAYNIWVGPDDGTERALVAARAVAAGLRGPDVRALGLTVGDRVQVSCNLVAPFRTGPGAVFDRIAAELKERGCAPDGAELVGLLPARVLAAEPASRHAALGLSEDVTIEARLGRAGISWR
jgi:glutamate formiminotransferase